MIKDTFDKHKNEPNKSIEQYLNELRLDLGKSILGRKKIYLDTKYWIKLRDVVLKREQNPNYLELLNLLRNGVKNKHLICPISYGIYDELLKQHDEITLNTTVSLIDELSEGTSIIFFEELVKFELLHFFRKYIHKEDILYSPDIFVWTKVIYNLGFITPTFNVLSTQEELLIQKSLLDYKWKLNLADIIQTMGMENIRNRPKFHDISENLNKGKFQYIDENKSFQDLLLSEFAGVVDVYKEYIIDAVLYLFEKETGQKATAEDRSSNEVQSMVNCIYNIYKFNKLGNNLPTLSIPSVLHAQVRHNRDQKYYKNDILDFHHATTALPYFDYFFTENPLKDLICRTNLPLDKQYNCIVLSKPEEIVPIVKTLVSN